MFNTPLEQIWAVAMFAVSAFALWRGGRVERAVAVANVVAWIASVVMQNRHNWMDPQWGVLGVDAAFLAFLLWLVVRTNRIWILSAAAFQLLAVVTHAAMLADDGVRAWAYITALVLWSYLVLITLGIGTYTYWRRASAPPAR